ncbi:hypothetical protein L2E82_33456 [Cichorium intybus]|uniref:Uncharacterized protein n=1 Tax=Cichorium intybus TaxID=13427 RepID=A0ACB9BK75_CICIN|nr:hypothetical protein L2E82_33456 [Cichorium intybus]
MKFGKEFTSQTTVPEWEEAYMNYNDLKTILKRIFIFRRRKQNQSHPLHSSSPKRNFLKRGSFYRAFSGLTNNRRGNYDNVDDAIVASETPLEEQPAKCQSHQTLSLRSLDEGGENELAFLRRLDGEFDKVNIFYRDKVEEVGMEAEELNKQMDALVAL